MYKIRYPVLGRSMVWTAEVHTDMEHVFTIHGGTLSQVLSRIRDLMAVSTHFALAGDYRWIPVESN